MSLRSGLIIVLSVLQHVPLLGPFELEYVTQNFPIILLTLVGGHHQALCITSPVTFLRLKKAVWWSYLTYVLMKNLLMLLMVMLMMKMTDGPHSPQLEEAPSGCSLQLLCRECFPIGPDGYADLCTGGQAKVIIVIL